VRGTRPGRAGGVDVFADPQRGVAAVEADVDDRDLAAPFRPLPQQMAGFEGVEGDGAGGGEGSLADGAGGGVEAAGNVDGEHGSGRGGPRHRRGRQLAAEADPEEGIDHQIGGDRAGEWHHPGAPGAGPDIRPERR
jgi:hypothetical protein